MKLSEKIALLQALLAAEDAYAELLKSLTRHGLAGGADDGDVEDMKEIVKDWLCKLVLRNEVKS